MGGMVGLLSVGPTGLLPGCTTGWLAVGYELSSPPNTPSPTAFERRYRPPPSMDSVPPSVPSSGWVVSVSSHSTVGMAPPWTRYLSLRSVVIGTNQEGWALERPYVSGRMESRRYCSV